MTEPVFNINAEPSETYTKAIIEDFTKYAKETNQENNLAHFNDYIMAWCGLPSRDFL